MPRALATYTAADWRRLRPVTQYYKEVLYRLEDRLFSARAPASPGDFAAACARLAGRALAITVAFNRPETIGWQIRFCRQNLRGAQLVVIDNSTDAEAADRIGAICRDAGIAYIRLRRGRTDPRGGSRSHAAALNWAYRRLVRRLQPPLFAFIDHDCYPLLPVELPALVAAQPIYGRLALRQWGWYLWAGFCVFRWSEATARRLNFRTDLFAGLDTGGAGWGSFYRHLDRNRLRFASVRLVESADPAHVGTFERIDDWLHLGNSSGWMATPPGREATIAALLPRALADPAGTLAALRELPPPGPILTAGEGRTR